MNIADRKNIRYLGEARVNPVIKFSFKVERLLAGTLKQYILSGYSPLLIGMMLEKGAVPFQIREMFTKVGVVHILAISGLHVGIMSGILLLLFRILNIPKRVSYGITFVFIIFYALLTGLAVPVVRAALMVDIFLLGYIIRRRTNIFITLALAALLLLSWNPYYLFEAGFQLSFVTVLCIVLITPKLESFLGLGTKWSVKPAGNLFLIVLRIFIVSVAAWLGSLPLVAYHFNYVSWIAPFSNMIIVPLVTAILACGFLLLLCSLISPVLSHFVGMAVKNLLVLLLSIAEKISSWKFIYIKLPAFNLWIVVIYYALLFGFLYYMQMKRLVRAKKFGNET